MRKKWIGGGEECGEVFFFFKFCDRNHLIGQEMLVMQEGRQL